MDESHIFYKTRQVWPLLTSLTKAGNKVVLNDRKPHITGTTTHLNYNVLVNYMYTVQWRIQDFPEGGREPSRGGVNTPNFPENCMKSKEFGRPGGGVRPSRPPLDPPMLCPAYNEQFARSSRVLILTL